MSLPIEAVDATDEISTLYTHVAGRLAVLNTLAVAEVRSAGDRTNPMLEHHFWQGMESILEQLLKDVTAMKTHADTLYRLVDEGGVQ